VAALSRRRIVENERVWLRTPAGGETEMGTLEGKVAWITGAGSGIGLAGAQALASAGATVVMSGRREQLLAQEAQKIRDTGGAAEVEVLDAADARAVTKVAAAILARHARIDILLTRKRRAAPSFLDPLGGRTTYVVGLGALTRKRRAAPSFLDPLGGRTTYVVGLGALNSAGMNTPNRLWLNQTVEGWRDVVGVNLDASFYTAHAVLPAMRERKDGLIINVSSWAGVFHPKLTGAAYNATKHALTAMTETINMEEGVNGIRACAICPAEVATPILDRRPVPPSAEQRARMLQPQDLGRTIRFIAEMPAHACINQIIISPTWNRIYIENL
jgi:NADP-dependent 3-hydroxy acid dehydrogenase YdfG